ncbi:MAG: deoxyribodipyrimidine photo-lyase [Pseudomonadota bacterium]
MKNIVWFRQDLRLTDNPALAHAASKGSVIGLYVLDETEDPSLRALGSASRWWLHHSLSRLEEAFGGIVYLRGDPRQVVPAFAQETGAQGVYWNRRYEPEAIETDTAVKAKLKADGFDVASFNGALLFEPWEVKTQTDGPYKVYSAFWRACLRQSISQPHPAPEFVSELPAGSGEPLSEWKLVPDSPDWADGFGPVWQPGEAGSQQRLEAFLKSGIAGYGHLRDRPDLENVSRLSPHIHFGEISPRQIWAAAKRCAQRSQDLEGDIDKFLAEIGWREFSNHLLYHFPTLPKRNLNTSFDAYPWVDSDARLRAWQKGRTGYPLVDAGMRELWSTGYMHNRVRMVAASFLTKHLQIDWRQGEDWFWDTLVDADLANNTASWQWVAGSGADAAPYFRIFNPTAQGRKFDPDGSYVRRWCPELAELPAKHIHAPSEAPPEILERAGVVLGQTYPLPMIDHKQARAAALDGYEVVKKSAAAAN